MGAGASSSKKSPVWIKLSKLKSNLKFLKVNPNCRSVGKAILNGLGSPMFVAISLNLACISSDGNYGLNTPLFKEL